MTIWNLIWMIAGLGALGGVANCIVAREFALPSFANGIWRPGWIGTVVVGAIAAVVVGGMYGPLAGYVINSPAGQALPLLTIQQLLGAVLVGLGGGTILTQTSQRLQDHVIKENLTSTVLTLSKAIGNSPAAAPTTNQPQQQTRPTAEGH